MKITNVKNTNSEVIELLYDKYLSPIYGLITNFISDKTKAEDVLFKIFQSLSAEIENYDHKQNLLIWISNLSRNECISLLIKENEKTDAAPVNSYVITLPLLEKTIFSLVYFKGLNINEVASLLHLPLNRIEDIFIGLPNFTPYLFPNIKKSNSPVADILQSLIQNIIPENDAERVAALKKYEILYTPAEEGFDKITQVIARVFNTPMSFLSFVDEDTVFYKSQVGQFGKSQVNRKDSFCALTILSKEPLVIEDVSMQSCFDDNPLVKSQNGIKFYAGAPLITKDGFPIGALCVVDTKKRTFSFKDTLLLMEFAEMAMWEIESRHETFQQFLFQEQLRNAIKNK